MFSFPSIRMNAMRDRGAAAPLAIVAAATLADLVLALYPRTESGYPPIALADLAPVGFDIWALVDPIAAVVLPVLAFFLLAQVPLLRSWIGGGMAVRLSLRSAGLGALIAAPILFFLLWQDLWPIWFYLFLVILLAVAGGWRLGLLAGLVTALTISVRNQTQYVLYDPAEPNAWLNVVAHIWEGTRLDLLFDQTVTATIWTGISAGLVAQWLGDTRWQTRNVAGLGGAVTVIAGYLLAVSQEDPTWITDEILPWALVNGVGLAAIAAQIGTIRGELAQRRVVEAELARATAELQALRAQINPHFLFNSINTIRYFVRTDPATARKLLIDLSDIFQQTLRAGDTVPLREEIRCVEAYLSLEKARLEERLQVAWHLPTGEPLEAPVPTLILQPVVENAVIHGISVQPAGGRLTITVDAGPAALHFTVQDDGAGFDPAKLGDLSDMRPGHSIGLRNVNRRLTTLYGPAYGLSIESSPNEGATVSFRVPVQDGADV